MPLKTAPSSIIPFTGDSSQPQVTAVPDGCNPRAYYLANLDSVRAPVVSSSEFVPAALVEHLMRRKKDEAIGEKFSPGGHPPDAVTNMEGALHTFVTPVTLAWMHGDYYYGPGHQVRRFKRAGSFQRARLVIVSASIQPDFELSNVMLELCSLRQEATEAKSLGIDFAPIDVAAKQETKTRAAYDDMLRSHMISHLTEDKRLLAIKDVPEVFSVAEIISTLERHLMKPENLEFPHSYVRLSNREKSTISLEILFNTAVQQLRNEISALEAVAPQGYVYTSDPPVIFAGQLDASLINRIQAAALQYLSADIRISKMRVFAFNDFADPHAVSLFKQALRSQPHIQVMSKAALFNDGQISGELGYRPPPGTEGALLVLHNNSDGFGQNIETEAAFGSMDGAIGANSSASASLHRRRADLVSHLL